MLRRLQRSGLPAGLTDSILSSLATFLVGLYATHHLDGDGLGLYAVAFSGFLFASMASAQSFLVPAEVANLTQADEHRSALLKLSLRRCLPVSVLWSSIVCGVVFIVPSHVAWSDKLWLIGTLWLTCAVSPLQDHARRVFHQARESWTAAGLSGLQLVFVAFVLGLGTAAHLSDFALPFTALFAANSFGLVVALLVVRRHAPSKTDVDPLRLFVAGRWLLLGGAFTSAAGFAGAVMLSTLAGAVYAGRGEAVRVLSQPVFVLTAGLSAVLGPRAMAAAQRFDRDGAARQTNRYMLATLVLSLGYAVVVGPSWPGSPIHDWFPAAYADTGLLFCMVLCTGFAYSLGLRQAELTGGGRVVPLAVISGVAAVAQLGAMAATLSLRTYSLVIGLAIGGIVRWVGVSIALRKHYGGPVELANPDALVGVPLPAAPEA